MDRKSVLNKGCDIKDLLRISIKFTDLHFRYLEKMGKYCWRTAQQMDTIERAWYRNNLDDKNIP